MRRWTQFFWLLIWLAAPALAAAQIPGEKFYVQGGLVIGKSVSGNYTAGLTSSEMLEPGTGYSAGIGAQLSSHYRIESNVVLLELPFKREYRPNKLWRPTFALPGWIFSNVLSWRMGPVSLDFPFGVGVYFWSFTEDGLGSDPLQFEGQALEKMSMGFHAGAELEFGLFRSLRLFVRGTYHYILSKDRFLFGEGFSEQGVMQWQSGIRWYFWQRNPLKTGKI